MYVHRQRYCAAVHVHDRNQQCPPTGVTHGLPSPSRPQQPTAEPATDTPPWNPPWSAVADSTRRGGKLQPFGGKNRL